MKSKPLNNYTNISLQVQTLLNKIFPSFHEAFSKYIKINGIKQSFLVANTGIDKASMSLYVSGKHMPKRTNKLLIENVLGVSFVQEKPNSWVIEEKNAQNRRTLKTSNSDYPSLDESKPIDELSFDELKLKAEELDKKNKEIQQLIGDYLFMLEDDEAPKERKENLLRIIDSNLRILLKQFYD